MQPSSMDGHTLFEPLEPRLLLSTTIFSEGFEGSFPGAWTVNVSQGRRWGEAMVDSHGGWQSAHCAVTQYGTETNNYVNNMNSTLTRTVNLAAYDEATLSFWYSMNAEPGYDGLTLKVNGAVAGSDMSGGTGRWGQVQVSLDAYCGQSSVTLQFQFTSDYSGVPLGYSGVWLDDVVLTATEAGPPADPDDQLIEAAFKDGIPFQATGAIDPDTDVDMYVFPVEAGDTVGFDIDRLSGTLDAYLRLFDDFGNELASNNSALAPGETTPSNDPYLRYTFAAAGWYCLGVSAAGNTAYDPDSGDGDMPGGSTGQYFLDAQFALGGADVSLYEVELDPWGEFLLPGGILAGFYCSFQNDGPLALNAAPYVIDLYLSTDQVITATDTLIGQHRETLSLPSGLGASHGLTISVTVPGSLASGTYYVGGHIRSESDIADPDDTNNWICGNAVLLTVPTPGDADCDGDVDLDDFVLLKQNFGNAAAFWDMGDFDSDKDVDLDDFVILKQNFGTTLAAPAARTDDLLAEPVEPLVRRIRRRLHQDGPRTGGAILDVLRTARLVMPRG